MKRRVWAAKRFDSHAVKLERQFDRSWVRVVLALRVDCRKRSAARCEIRNWERSVVRAAVHYCEVIRSYLRVLIVERAVASCCLREMLESESVLQPVVNF